MSSTKNVGQVVGLYVGTSAPTNTKLIWFDETPNQQCHKVYDPVTKLWKALNPEIVSNTTYSELVNNAQKNGLSIGKFYQITDRSNTLAIAITTTKVQYSDSLGNFLIDDLGSNIQYHVSSGNLLIDDLNGVFNTDTNKLVFQFSEQTPNVDTDYVFGKSRIGNAWSLAKYKLSSFLSKATGNSLTWNGGIFFNFSEAIKALIDKVGGIVGYDGYRNDIQKLTNDINNVAKENQNIIDNAAQDTTDKTTDTAIFNKKLPSSIETSTAPGDVLVNDTLFTIVSKFQRWINQFKYATGIRISNGFKDATRIEYVNNNDTVESALGKIQYMLKNPTTAGTLPEDWTTLAPRNDGQPTDGTYDAFEQDGYPVAGDSIFYAFAKIVAFLQGSGEYVKLSSDWIELDYTKDVDFPRGGDSFNQATQKAVAKLRQLGIISNGRLTSHDGTKYNDHYKTEFNIDEGSLEFNGILSKTHIDENLFSISRYPNSEKEEYTFRVEDDVLEYYARGVGLTHNGIYSAAYFEAQGNTSATFAALSAYARNKLQNTFDALFGRLRVGLLTYEIVSVSTTTYNITESGFVVYMAGRNGDIYLPTSPSNGCMVMICLASNGRINIHASGNIEIDTIGESVATVTVSDRGAVYAFFYISGTKYNNDPISGMWEYAKWTSVN